MAVVTRGEVSYLCRVAEEEDVAVLSRDGVIVTITRSIECYHVVVANKGLHWKRGYQCSRPVLFKNLLYWLSLCGATHL